MGKYSVNGILSVSSNDPTKTPSGFRVINLFGETLTVTGSTVQCFVSSYSKSQRWGAALMDHSAPRCTMRWLAPGPSWTTTRHPRERRATPACCSSTGHVSTAATSRVRRGVSANPRIVAPEIGQCPQLFTQPPDAVEHAEEVARRKRPRRRYDL
jgi:hypothetical protein